MTFTYSSISKGNNDATGEFTIKQVVNDGKLYDVSVNPAVENKMTNNMVSNIITHYPEANNIVIYGISEK